MVLSPTSSAVSEQPFVLPQTARPMAGEPKGKSWSAAEGQREVSVSLAALPTGVAFPEDFPEPIRFDVSRRLISYRGQMYHSSYLYLLSLSKDAAYGHAIDKLFADSVPPVAKPSSVPWGMLAVAALIIAGIAGLVIRLAW